MRTLLLACSVPLLTGCCAVGSRPDLCRTIPPSEPNPVGVVFVANGSGDFHTVSTNLGRVVAETSTPLQVETVPWSHGFCRYVTDHLGHANHVQQGSRLAADVTEYRQAYPGRKVYLIGHSAGCAVVLAAAERLPTDSVDRLILLAPSVCVTYDLRPALRTARCGIDVFHSDKDSVILGLGTLIVGTADHRCRTAAGQYGLGRSSPARRMRPCTASCGNTHGTRSSPGVGMAAATMAVTRPASFTRTFCHSWLPTERGPRTDTCQG